MNSPRESLNDSFYKLFLVILATLLVLAIGQLSNSNLVRCDESKLADNSEAAGQEFPATDSDGENQAADPEYIKKELKELTARSIDLDKDGYVSYEEMKTYLAQLHDENIKFNVDKQWVTYSPQIHEVFSWEGYEPERIEVLTWDHYFNQTYPELMGIDIGIPIHREQDTSSIINPTETPKQTTTTTSPEELEQDSHLKALKLMAERADRRWKLADENGDTLLTKAEFKLLLHPDEGNEALKELFVKEATEDMDANKDGKICLDEFMKHLQVLASDQEKNDQGWLSNQQENFGRFLDKNKDGVLEGDEIKEWLVPSRSKMFESEAKRIFDIGDTNEDHKLSIVEILEQYHQFLNLLPSEYWQPESLASTTNNNQAESPSLDVVHDEL